jgi:hypothetical protein
MTRGCLGTLAAALAALVLTPSASASCVPPPPLERSLADAPIVFVGTVVRVTNQGRTATFRVEDVWKGEVAGTVVVHGGQEGANVWSSVDRTYRKGKRYLVVPYRSQRDVFLDNACSPTREYASGLDAFRPGVAGRAAPKGSPSAPAASVVDEADGGVPWLIVGLAGGAAAAASGAAIQVVRRFRTR